MPCAVTDPTAEAVINEATATGPTDNVRLLPNSAYATSGRIDAYSPISAGKPASKAYAKDCGISMIVTMTAARLSLTKC